MKISFNGYRSAQGYSENLRFRYLPMSSFHNDKVRLDESNEILTCLQIWWKHYFVGVHNE